MSEEVYVFGDESGQLEFHPKASRYFILTTIVVPDGRIFDELLTLRRQLAWEGMHCHPEFHATDERQLVCAFWRARTDPRLWAVDYCSWAIQRKWEHTWQGTPDDRSYRLIQDKIGSEFELFRRGTTTYY